MNRPEVEISVGQYNDQSIGENTVEKNEPENALAKDFGLVACP